MGKITFVGLLFIFATIIVATNAFAFHPFVGSSAIKRFPPIVSNEGDLSEESIDDRERILCNAIVRATHDLHVHQKKSANDINSYLDEDCKKLANEELINQCHEMITEHGARIYEYVKSETDISQICGKINDYNEMDLEYNDDDDDGKTECSRKSKDACQCCRMHVEKRKMRLQHIVKQMARKRIRMCKNSHRPHQCRHWIRKKEREFLRRIARICPHAVCKHLGYCKRRFENNISKIDLNVNQSPLLLEILLDQQLDTYFTNNICKEFEPLQTVCVHISASVDSRRYTKAYVAMLRDDTTWIEKNLHKEIERINTDTNGNQCDTCKNAIQVSTNFYTKNLETVHKTLKDTCGRCSSKEKCEEVFDKQFETINNYLNSIKPNQICSVNHRCDGDTNEKCSTCIEHFQPRKDAAKKAIDRLTSYFPQLCTKSNDAQCLQFVSEITAEIRLLIDEYDVQKTCLTMGFCEQNAVESLNDYEHAYIEVMNKEICPMLGPLETICQQIIQGDSTKMETINFNINDIREFFERCEDAPDKVVAKIVHESQEKDKCQCCIHRVIQKKKCWKQRVAKYVEHMEKLCERCPAREKCERHWEEKKACWDAKIDKICPKKVCIHRGYCNGTQSFGRPNEQPVLLSLAVEAAQPEIKNDQKSETNKKP